MIKSPFTKLLTLLLALSLLNSSLAVAMIAPFSSLGGNIQIGGKKQSDADLAKKGINRDLNHTQIITKDQQTGGLDATVTVDHRLASEKGRNSIREDVLKSGMFIDAAKQVVTTDKVGIFDFNAQLGKQHNTYEGIKAKLKDNPKLAQQLNDPNLSPEQKQKIFNRLADGVMQELGYKKTDVKVISTDETGQSGGLVQGHTGADGKVYINDKHNGSTQDNINTLGHELAHVADQQDGTFKPGDKDQNTYANNYGKDVGKYTNFINTTFNNQGLAGTNNHKGNTDSELVKNNNQDFSKLDKSKGDDAVPLILVAVGVAELIDKGIAAYDMYQLQNAIEENRMDDATQLAAELGIGFATEAVPGNKVLVKLASMVGLGGAGLKAGNKMPKDIPKTGDVPKVEVSDKTPEINTTNDFNYNLVENPGPLANIRGNPASNFAGGKYNEIELQEDVILYRGGSADTGLGQWFTRTPPDSVAQVRIDSAVKSQWIDPKTGELTGTSPINAVHTIKIPKGTKIYEGPVGHQGGVNLGGQDRSQIFINQPWRVKGVEVIDTSPLK